MPERNIEEMINIAEKAWSKHPAASPVELIDKIEAYGLAKYISDKLGGYTGPGQVLDEVYVDQRIDSGLVSKVGMLAVWEGVSEFTHIEGINCIGFESDPDWGAENGESLLQLIIKGSHPEVGKHWETKYLFGSFDIKKQEGIVGKPMEVLETELEEADMQLINQVLVNMKNKVGKRLIELNQAKP